MHGGVFHVLAPGPSLLLAPALRIDHALNVARGEKGRLAVTLLWRGPFAWIFALTIVGGLAAFLSQVVWMLRHRRPPPAGLRQPDPAVLHAGASLVSLAIASALGVWLTLAEPSESTLRVAMAYGVLSRARTCISRSGSSPRSPARRICVNKAWRKRATSPP